MSALYDEIVAAIRRIPRGRVATYGQIAVLAGNTRAARTVSYVLHSSARKLDLPWHRVINARGTISLPREGGGYDLQKRRLEAEGVVFDSQDRVDLKRCGWQAKPENKPKPVRKKKLANQAAKKIEKQTRE